MNDHPTYPGYDVLAKRDTPSWNERTRVVVAQRLATPTAPRFFTHAEWSAGNALCRRVMPGEVEVPLVALLDAKLLKNEGDGTRAETMPYMRKAWRRGLAGLDREARARDYRTFASLVEDAQDALLSDMQAGRLTGEAWDGIDPATFFRDRVLVDVPPLFYSLPSGWSEIGFGGPASPRGYVRLDGDRRDAWEAAEAETGREWIAERENLHVV